MINAATISWPKAGAACTKSALVTALSKLLALENVNVSR
jgi:hypothetical protein